MINKWLTDFFRIVLLRIAGLGIVNFFCASFLSTYLDATSSGVWILAILLVFFLCLGGGAVVGGFWTWIFFRKHTQVSWIAWIVSMILFVLVLQWEYRAISEVSEMYIYTNIIIGQQVLADTLVLYALKYPYSRSKRRNRK